MVRAFPSRRVVRPLVNGKAVPDEGGDQRRSGTCVSCTAIRSSSRLAINTVWQFGGAGSATDGERTA